MRAGGPGGSEAGQGEAGRWSPGRGGEGGGRPRGKGGEVRGKATGAGAPPSARWCEAPFASGENRLGAALRRCPGSPSPAAGLGWAPRGAAAAAVTGGVAGPRTRRAVGALRCEGCSYSGAGATSLRPSLCKPPRAEASRRLKLGFRTRGGGFPRAPSRLCESPSRRCESPPLLVSVLDASSTAFARVTSTVSLPGYPNLNYYFV